MQLDNEHIPVLNVSAKLVRVQSNHRLGSRSRHWTTRRRQRSDQLIFPGSCSSCLHSNSFIIDTNAVFFRHLNYRGQGVGSAHTKARAVPRVSPSGQWPLRGQAEQFLTRRKASVRITPPSLSSSKLYCTVDGASRTAATVSSIRVLRRHRCRSPPYSYLIWCLKRHKGSGLAIIQSNSQPTPAIWL